jgi:hypothetical protein
MNSDDRNFYENVSDIIEEFRPGQPSSGRPRSGRIGRNIKRIIVFVVIAVFVFAALLYAADYVVARYRVSRGQGLGSVNVQQLYAIRQKNGQTEFDDLGTERQTCVHSCFPHFGYAPCWYLNRHSEQRTNF